MSDEFYGPFDRTIFCNEVNRERKPDYRSIFHGDRDRVMFSSSFRRLQAKTQVFQAGEYDFYRTRLTHSLEVSRIAESIAIFLGGKHPEVQIDRHLLESICLSHDIGHPPFGHAGERELNALMEKYGGFEGNAQTLRILTRIIYDGSKGRGGMSPSRALLDGVLKYKRLFKDRGADTHHFIYDDQIDVLRFCFDTEDFVSQLNGAAPNDFKSIECQIMDLADDIAYSSFDILDGAKARFITADRIADWRDQQREHPGKIIEKHGDWIEKHVSELLEMMAKKSLLQPKMNGIIGDLIQSTSLAPQNNFMTAKTRRYAYKLQCTPQAGARIALHKELGRRLVYRSSALQQIEYKGGKILKGLAGALFANYLDEKTPAVALLPTEVHHDVSQAETGAARARLLCDYLSGMTDAYALRNYKRLLDPDYGSISELI